ncbi:proteasome complex subunit Rpn13 ubiquitin receptor-domain-containing protein [Pyronema omphalodes]|nr:proteasome complex subunit Rpn13 ubiquitin receptor-domain-containing protein [Pyronema omphalodes]
MPAIQPVIAIKAGKCLQDGTTVIPQKESGILYIYLSPEDDLYHLCWKARDAVEPEDDRVLIPGDCRLLRHDSGPTGRIFMLKFASSSERNFFWLQSQPEGEPGHWSQRDKNWIKRMDRIMQGESEDDEEMGDAPIDSGDIEAEGEQPRRGGEDGGRAIRSPLIDVVSVCFRPAPQFDLTALLRGIQVPSDGAQNQYRQPATATSLTDLLSTPNTVPLVASMSEETLNNLISNLPPTIIPENATVAQKKEVITKVLRSAQFTQGAASLTAALREGALRAVADSLRVPLQPGEETTGEDPVEVFVKAIKRQTDE